MNALLTPKNLPELLALIEEYKGCFTLVAGGTDWTIRQAEHTSHNLRVIDLSGVFELRGIETSGDEIWIGALETMTAVSENSSLKFHAPCLCEAAKDLGSWQIRNRATLGGNLANASPAADTPVALAALDARAAILSPRGEREADVEKIPDGPNKNTLAADEIVRGFRIPLRPGRISAFGKIGSRSEVSVARLNLAASLRCAEESEKIASSEARVFVGTLGTAVRRCEPAEHVLIQGGLRDADAFAETMARVVEEAIPGRATLPYKCSAIRALAEDVLLALRRKAEERGEFY